MIAAPLSDMCIIIHTFFSLSRAKMCFNTVITFLGSKKRAFPHSRAMKRPQNTNYYNKRMKNVRSGGRADFVRMTPRCLAQITASAYAASVSVQRKPRCSAQSVACVPADCAHSPLLQRKRIRRVGFRSGEAALFCSERCLCSSRLRSQSPAPTQAHTPRRFSFRRSRTAPLRPAQCGTPPRVPAGS